MKKVFFNLIPLFVFILSGCSSKYEVTFDSNPRGATLICDGTNWGYTPKKLYYSEDEKNKIHTSLSLESCSANWISGVKEHYGIIDLNQFPDGFKQTLQRPDVAGYEKDAQFALQVEIMQIQKRQAKAEEDQARSTAISNFDKSMQDIRQNMQNQNQDYQLQQINNNLNRMRN